jgi:hypothetical protein
METGVHHFQSLLKEAYRAELARWTAPPLAPAGATP